MFKVIDLDDLTRVIVTGSRKMAREYFDALRAGGGMPIATRTEFGATVRVFAREDA